MNEDVFLRTDTRAPVVAVVHYITRAWKVGQWRGGWYHDSTHHTWEGVKARAAFLRANGWETADAIPFFCIVDGAAVHEVRTGPLNARGEWVPERASVVRVDE